MVPMLSKAESLLLLVVLLSANPASANVYHWTDAEGVRHYSNTPPPQGVESTILQEEIPYDPETDDKRRVREDALLQERESAETRQRIEEAERKADEAERKAEAAKRKADQLEKELEEREDDRSYGVYYYPRRRPGHRPPGWRPPGHRPPGDKPPGWRPKPEPYYGTKPAKPWQQRPRPQARGEKSTPGRQE
jgi:hypothetical protein